MTAFVTVETTKGQIRGSVTEGINAFKGVPYAAAPVGYNRFRPPVPTEPWLGVRDALDFGPRSLQDEMSIQLPPPVRQLMRDPTPGAMDEDCLYLNVWAQASEGSAKRPVMLWLHGGAFIAGTGAEPWTNGTSLAARGVVVVTVNHRLGALGYLHLEEIGGPQFAGSSLAGMHDIVAALAWVKEEIGQFGGDPDNVTIFGESGGGAKVCILMAMPAARGLFQRAIIQSGPAVRMAERQDGTATATAFLNELGLDASQVEALRSLPADVLLKAQSAVLSKESITSFAERRRRGFNPVAGQPGLPTHPFDPVAPALSADIPLMIGTNKDEMTIFFTSSKWFEEMDDDDQLEVRLRGFVGEDATSLIGIYRKARPDADVRSLFLAIVGDQGMRLPSLQIADRKSAQAAAPVFVYYFTKETAVLEGQLRSPHTLEIPYVFDTTAVTPMVKPRADAKALANIMSQTWATFAASGNPNNPSIPHWPAYDASRRATLILNDTCRIEGDPQGSERRAWSELAK
jgi:para-nitrobenzyl esterase